MDVRMAVVSPGDVEVRLEVTMTLSQWMGIAQALPPSYPGSRLSIAIRDAVRQVEKTVLAIPPQEGDK